MEYGSIFKKIKSALLGEKTVELLDITQEFPIYGLPAETYRIKFIDNVLGFRSFEIISSDFCSDRRLWMATEFYALTIVPWMRHEITNEALRSHVDIIKGLTDSFIDNLNVEGVIKLNQYKKKKKIRRDKF
jgi:hypothetical protein